MTQEQILSIVRQVLLMGGGFVVARGWVSNDVMVWITGGIAAAIGSVWAFWAKRPSGLVASAATLPHVQTITVNSNSALADVPSTKVVTP